MSDEDKKPSEAQERRNEKRQKQRDNIAERKNQRILSNCKICLSNNSILEEQIISYAQKTFLMIPENCKNATLWKNFRDI